MIRKVGLLFTRSRRAFGTDAAYVTTTIFWTNEWLECDHWHVEGIDGFRDFIHLFIKVNPLAATNIINRRSYPGAASATATFGRIRTSDNHPDVFNPAKVATSTTVRTGILPDLKCQIERLCYRQRYLLCLHKVSNQINYSFSS